MSFGYVNYKINVNGLLYIIIKGCCNISPIKSHNR